MSQSPYDQNLLTQCFPGLKNFDFIAKGGQKAVYSADHETHGKIALKIHPPGPNPERFLREITAVQSIAAGQVPVIFDSGCLPSPHADHLWLTEQWIEGSSLSEKIRTGSLSNSLILKIGLNILAVLVEAEAHNIVHRDIKPDNILIAPDDSCSWLVDFGIARHLDKTSLTQAFMPYTLGYAPIEQLNAAKKEIDSRSDLFSLGVTLFECVEGYNPYTHGAASTAEVIHRTENLHLPKLSRQIDVSDQFKDLIGAMTQPMRNHRIGNAKEAYTWMQEISAAGPI